MCLDKLAIFLHLGDTNLWGEISKYIERANESNKSNFDLYVNFCPDLSSDDKISQCKTIIENNYPGTVFFSGENRGCDIGPYFKFLDYLRKRDVEYHTIIKLHSKTEKDKREKMMNGVLPPDFSFEKLKDEDIQMKGWKLIPYDYFNIKYDLEHIKLLGLNMKVNWDNANKMFPQIKGMSALEKRIISYQNFGKMKGYIPDIDPDLYKQLFGSLERDHIPITGGRKEGIINSLINKNVLKCKFIPGTIFLHRHNLFINAFKNVDYNKIYHQLEPGKPKNYLVQSRVHSWERIFSFIIYGVSN